MWVGVSSKVRDEIVETVLYPKVTWKQWSDGGWSVRISYDSDPTGPQGSEITAVHSSKNRRYLEDIVHERYSKPIVKVLN